MNFLEKLNLASLQHRNRKDILDLIEANKLYAANSVWDKKRKRFKSDKGHYEEIIRKETLLEEAIISSMGKEILYLKEEIKQNPEKLTENLNVYFKSLQDEEHYYNSYVLGSLLLGVVLNSKNEEETIRSIYTFFEKLSKEKITLELHYSALFKYNEYLIRELWDLVKYVRENKLKN